MNNPRLFIKAFSTAFLINLTTFQAVSAPDQCKDIFAKQQEAPLASIVPANTELHAVRLKADRLPELIKDKKDPRFNQSIVNLLRMLTDTVFMNASHKLTIEKGELRLGRLLNDGKSLEFVYIGDKRGDETIFRLNRILLIKPNGQDATLDKAPVTVDGVNLANPNLLISTKTKEIENQKVPVEMKGLTKEDLEGWIKDAGATEDFLKALKSNSKGISHLIEKSWDKLTPEDKSKLEVIKTPTDIEVPVTLQGPVLTEFLKWIDRVPFLERSEVRAYLSNTAKSDVKKLYWKARFRSDRQFMADVTKKQAFKFVLIGAVLYGYGHFITAQIIPDQLKTSPKDAALAMPLSRDEVGILTQILGKADPDWQQNDPVLSGKIQERVGFNLNRDPLNDHKVLHSYLHDLANKETKKNGLTSYYFGDSTLASFSTALNEEQAKYQASASKEGGFMIAHFKALERVVIVPVVSRNSDKLANVVAVLVEREKNASTYDRIKQMLEQTNRSLDQMFSDGDD